VVAEDPFGSFDNEEVLTDAYSPFVAQQNQRSLDLTSEQLQDLTPTDLEGSQSPISEADATPDVETEESFPTFETAMQPPEPVREPAQPTHEQRDSLETREATGPLGPSSLSEEFLVNRDAQSSDSISVSVNPAVSASPTQVISTETAPQEGFETQSQQIVAPNDSVPQVPDLSAPVEAKDSAATVYHEQSPTPNDTEIRRQAEEIIASLDVPGETGQEPFPVSHETLPSEPTVKEEMNAIEATIQRSIAAGQAAANEPANPTAEATPPVVMPDINAIQQALQQAQDRNGYQQIASTQPTEPVAPQSPEQLSPQNWPVPSQSEPQQTQPQQTQPQQTQPIASNAADSRVANVDTGSDCTGSGSGRTANPPGSARTISDDHRNHFRGTTGSGRSGYPCDQSVATSASTSSGVASGRIAFMDSTGTVDG